MDGGSFQPWASEKMKSRNFRGDYRNCKGPKIILSYKLGAGFEYVLVFIPIMTSTDLFQVGWRNQQVTTFGCAVHFRSILGAVFTYVWQGSDGWTEPKNSPVALFLISTLRSHPPELDHCYAMHVQTASCADS